MNVILVGVALRHLEVIERLFARNGRPLNIIRVRDIEACACAYVETDAELVIAGTRFIQSIDDLRLQLEDFGYDGPIGAIVRDMNDDRPNVDFVLPDGFGTRVSRRVLAREGLIRRADRTRSRPGVAA
jgi:hypothetical protein